MTQLFSWWEETGIIQTVLTPEGSPLWTLTQDVPNFSKIPPTLGAILDERIRLMGKRLQDILTRASIEGEDFSAQVIINLLDLDELQAFEDIDTLERNYQLVQEQETRQIGNAVFDMYRFVHRFFREHIYGHLNKRIRRNLHQQVGECLEQVCSEKEVIAGQLARHFGEAGQDQKATNYALMAAKYEQSRFAWDEGEQWCIEGLSLIKSSSDNTESNAIKLDLLEQSGEGFFYAGNYDKAYNRYLEALDAAIQQNADNERIASIYVCLADICDEKGLFDDGKCYVEKGKALINLDSLSETKIALVSSECLFLIRLGQGEIAYTKLLELLNEAQEMKQTSSLSRILADIYNALAISLEYREKYHESIAMYQKAVDLAEKLGYLAQSANAMANLADCLILVGKLEDATIANAKALAYMRQIGELAGEGWALSISGEINLRLGKYDEAISNLEQAISLLEGSGSIWGLSFSYAAMALAQVALSQFEIAYENALKSKILAEPDKRKLAYSMEVLGRVETSRQNYAEAIEYFEKSLAFHEDLTDRHLRARTQRHYAETLFLIGKREKAESLILTSIETFENLNLQYEVEKSQHLLKNYE